MANLLTDGLGLRLASVTKSRKAGYQLLAYAAVEEPVDALIIGSSAVEKGVDPVQASERLTQELGRPAVFYALGIGGLRTTLLADVLEELVRANQPEGLLVVAIENRSFCRAVSADGNQEIHGEWEEQGRSSARIRQFDGLRALWRIPATFAPSSLERIRTIASHRGADVGKSLDWEPEAERRRALPEEALEAAQERSRDRVWIWCGDDSVELRDWRRAVKSLERLSCRVLVVKMPFAEGFEDEEMPGTGELFRTLVLTDLERRGIEFEDLSRPPFPRKPVAFTDGFHLTKAGRRTTTKFLVDEIVAPRLP
jgi:hypothetical protein